MEVARANLRLVGDTGADTFPWPDSGELISFADAQYRIRDLIDEAEGLTKLTRKQARENAALQRRVAEDESAHTHARGKEIVELIEHWKAACNHPNSKVSGDRVKLVKARLKDGFDFETLRLAVDGLASAPYVVNAQRRPTGTESQRYDQLSHALKSGEKVEQFANLGYRVVGRSA